MARGDFVERLHLPPRKMKATAAAAFSRSGPLGLLGVLYASGGGVPKGPGPEASCH